MHRRLSWRRQKIHPTDVRTVYKSQVRDGLMGTGWRWQTRMDGDELERRQTLLDVDKLERHQTGLDVDEMEKHQTGLDVDELDKGQRGLDADGASKRAELEDQARETPEAG